MDKRDHGNSFAEYPTLRQYFLITPNTSGSWLLMISPATTTSSLQWQAPHKFHASELASFFQTHHPGLHSDLVAHFVWMPLQLLFFCCIKFSHINFLSFAKKAGYLPFYGNISRLMVCLYFSVITIFSKKTPQIKLGSLQKLCLAVLRLRLNIYKAPTVS